MRHDGVLRAKCLQHLFAGNILPCLGFLGLIDDFHLAKKDVAHLFWRCHVERFASRLVDFLLQLQHAFGENLRCFFQCSRVNAHAVTLHFGQNRYQRHLHFVEKTFHTSLNKLGLKHVFKLQRYVGIFASVGIHLARSQFAHVFLRFSLRSDKGIDVHCFVVQVHFGHEIHVMAQFGLQQIMGNHGIEEWSLQHYSIVAKNFKVVFYILSYL